MRRRDLLALSGMVLGGALAGCLRDEGIDAMEFETRSERSGLPPMPEVDPATDIDAELVAELARGNTAFAFDLYHRVVAEDVDANLVFSPYSVSVALAMTYAGARGSTMEEMRDVLRFQVGDSEVHEGFGGLSDELEVRSDVEIDRRGPGGEGEYQSPVLEVANALWGAENLEYKQEFLDLVERSYGAGLRRVDFGDPGAADRINGWVSGETNDKIEELVSENDLSRDTVLVLTNAVYFAASWAEKFTERATEQAEFRSLDGTTSKVMMMESPQVEFPYAEVDGHQVVELPYVGRETSMLVILPGEDVDFDDFERGLDASRLREFVEALEGREGTVYLPRFKYRSDFSVKSVLESLGMTRAFDPGRADFSGVIEGSAWLDDVIHESYIGVDEQGTEAAAATAVIVAQSAPLDPFEFRADRPFVYAIRDRRTSTVLFLGRVVDADALE